MARRNKFARRKVQALRRSLMKQPTPKNKITLIQEHANRYATQLTKNSTYISPVAPLIFQRHTTRVVESESKKMRAIV